MWLVPQDALVPTTSQHPESCQQGRSLHSYEILPRWPSTTPKIPVVLAPAQPRHRRPYQARHIRRRTGPSHAPMVSRRSTLTYDISRSWCLKTKTARLSGQLGKTSRDFATILSKILGVRSGKKKPMPTPSTTPVQLKRNIDPKLSWCSAGH